MNMKVFNKTLKIIEEQNGSLRHEAAVAALLGVEVY